MRSPTRIPLLAFLAIALLAVPASVAHAAFGVSKWEAGTCVESSCKDAGPHSEFYSQAAGHPNFGITDFRLNGKKVGLGEEPEGNVRKVRVDIPPGLTTNPFAVPQCTRKQLEALPKQECPAGSKVGEDELTIFLGVKNETVKAPVFNMVSANGVPAEFGVDLEEAKELSYIVGGVSWNTDYHEYFTISNIPSKIPVIGSRLMFKGNIGTLGNGAFLTLPSQCAGQQVTKLLVESYEGQTAEAENLTPVGVSGCNLVPFEPSLALNPETAQSDLPDGITTEVKLPHDPNPEHLDSATVRTATVTLPEGMTLNPSAAHGLEGCTPQQIGIGTTGAVSCPESSKVGTVTIETPVLPKEALKGNLYLGKPTSGSITGPPYTIYVDAESARYGVSVRLKGSAVPNESSGRVTTTFSENPQAPFSDFILHLNGGPLAPVANPLACGTATTELNLTPFTGQPAALSSNPFATEGCPSPLPFSLSQSTQDQPANAGAHASFTFNLARADGQQYLSQVKTVLPPGLVGLIGSLTLCGEPQAAQGTCSAASEIGTATVSAGAGPSPFSFSGPVYMTGPYNGAPFGLSIPVAAVAGPFNLGTVVTRATINVDPTTARVTVTSTLPTIVKGIPIRLKGISVSVNRPNFLINPTSCGSLATESTLSGFIPGSSATATESLSSPFELANCGALAFTPLLTAETNANTSKADGASLTTTVSQPPGQANIQSVTVALPSRLVTRLTTLQQACPEATYTTNPARCPAGSNVGTATANTPVLPGPLTGPALLVSHGGAAFPDLDLLLEGSGVRVVLVGNTNINAGVTTTTFRSLPDVPVTSFALDLPRGPHSALTANGELCAAPIVMPITIVAQNGAQVRQNTNVSVAGCPPGHGAHARRGVKILRRKVTHTALILTIQTFDAGRLRCSGKNLQTVSRRVRKDSTTTLKMPLSRSGLSALRRHHKLKVRVRVWFVPARAGLSASSATATVALH
jgi:hypothetical protein